MGERRVVVTGIGTVGPAGVSTAGFWEALVAGREGSRAIERFDTSEFRSHRAALVSSFVARDFVAAGRARRMDPASLYAVAATRLALQSAAYPIPPPDSDGIGVVVGSASAGASPVREFLEPVTRQGAAGAMPMVFPNTVGNAPASYSAIELGLGGPNVTVSQKEASGLLAVATAWDFVREGRALAMVAGGADEVAESVFRVFDRIGVLARGGLDEEGSRPWVGTNTGFVMGEGAYMLVLEDAGAAAARGAPMRVVVLGHGVASDGVRPDRWPTSETAVARACAEALDEAGVAARDIDLVIASANGAADLERVEARALARLFGDTLPPVTSVKRLAGEMGGSGAASLVAAVLSVEHGVVFPCIGGREPLRDGLPFAPPRLAAAAAIGNVLVTSLGSGGTCAAMVVGRG